MRPEEIQHELHRLHFEGKWTKSALCKEFALSRPVLYAAFDGKMSKEVQVRLEHSVKMLPIQSPIKRKKNQKAPKHKLMRILNLRYWIKRIETATGRVIFKESRCFIHQKNAAFLSMYLDYVLKTYIVKELGTKIEEKNLFLTDCYPVEKWIEKLVPIFPERRDLWHFLTTRPKHETRSPAASRT